MISVTLLKRIDLKRRLARAGLALLLCLPGLAALPPQAAAILPGELDALVREQARKEAIAAQEREAAFTRALQEQEARTRDMVAQRDAAEDLSNRLSRRYDENELMIAELSDLLELHQGNLGELFGVTRQVAGDAASVLGASLISTQFPPRAGEEGRSAFLLRLAGATALPSIFELERLWTELLLEMSESARVLRYRAPVQRADGSVADTEAVRVAAFNAVSDGRYLGYLPGAGSFVELERQPAGAEFREAAEALQAAGAAQGYLPAVVDPARGALLALIVQRPGLGERIAEGEVVGYLIIGVGAIGMLAALFQYLYLAATRLKLRGQLRQPQQPQPDNPLGRLLLAAREGAGEAAEVSELRISEAVLREVPKLERFQSFLRLAVAAGPLLGLIGTVIGMIITFESITASGSSDPKLMAQGIGQAMIATVLGLGVAIPLLFVNAGLVSLSRSVVQVLEEQATALMARRLDGIRSA